MHSKPHLEQEEDDLLVDPSVLEEEPSLAALDNVMDLSEMFVAPPGGGVESESWKGMKCV